MTKNAEQKIEVEKRQGQEEEEKEGQQEGQEEEEKEKEGEKQGKGRPQPQRSVRKVRAMVHAPPSSSVARAALPPIESRAPARYGFIRAAEKFHKQDEFRCWLAEHKQIGPHSPPRTAACPAIRARGLCSRMPRAVLARRASLSRDRAR